MSEATPPLPPYAFMYCTGKILLYCDTQNMSGIEYFCQKLEITLMMLAYYPKKTRGDGKEKKRISKE
jgi:hypothetical protein